MATRAKVSFDFQNSLTIQERRLMLEYAKSAAERAEHNLSEFRSLLVFRDRAYIRQTNVTQKQLDAVRKNMMGDFSKIQDITVPIVMPQVETSVAYQAGVFLTSHPIFGTAARAAEIDVAQQFEALLAQQSQQWGWPRELIKVFRNGFKYNYGPALVDWETIPIRKIENSTNPNRPGGTIIGATITGNAIRSLDPYNCFGDPMVSPAEMHTCGEFYGFNELISKVELQRRISRLDPTKTALAKQAYESTYSGTDVGQSGSGSSATSYYYPEINRYYANLKRPPEQGNVNWLRWLEREDLGRQQRINYKNSYIYTTMFCRVSPSDLGRSGNLPLLYKLHIVNWSQVVYAELLSLPHDYMPTVVMVPNDDGLRYQSLSSGDNAMPYQEMASAMWGMTMESQRRAVYDRLLYNPQFINARDIDPANATARIPVKNSGALNFEPGKAIYKIPYDRTDAAMTVQLAGQLAQMADEASGQNRVARGQFQKGNKTQDEFTRTMEGSNSRNQLAALTIEGQFMGPVKEMVKANTVLNQQQESILDTRSGKVIDIDPVKLRETMLKFTMTDGVLPSSKLLSTDVMQVFLQMGSSMPAVQAEYDLVGLFLYWCKSQGANWVDDFKRGADGQANYLKLMQASATAANSQPMQGPAVPTAGGGTVDPSLTAAG